MVGHQDGHALFPKPGCAGEKTHPHPRLFLELCALRRYVAADDAGYCLRCGLDPYVYVRHENQLEPGAVAWLLPSAGPPVAVVALILWLLKNSGSFAAAVFADE